MVTIERKKNLLKKLEQLNIEIRKIMLATNDPKEIKFLDEMLKPILDGINTIKSDLQQSE